MPELAYVFNNKGQMLMWNKNVEQILGYTEDQLYLKTLADFIAPEDLEKTMLAMETIFRDCNEQTVEYSLKTKSGKHLPYIGSGSYSLVDGEEFFIGMAISTFKLKETDNLLKEQIIKTNELKNQIQAENIYLREEYFVEHDSDNIIGESDLLIHSLYRIEQVAPTNTSVLLIGETGTDKDRFANVLHKKSKRHNNPFIKVNCSSSQIESELYGHEKGAFEGALNKRIGRLELANSGSIYLEEIGELPKKFQQKLLRVIQDSVFERIGSSKLIKTDVRFIASTKHNIESLIEKGLFLEELYYRINIYPITIAPLRNRIIDIPLIAEHFVKKFNTKLGKNIKRITLKTMKELQRYSWPGNVHELENVIERAVIISQGSLLTIEPFISHHPKEKTTSLLPLAEYERQYIIRVLEKTYWRVDGINGAAKILEMHPETLRSRMRKLGIKRP
jgi:PAS domain S-box-containing protein